MFRRIYRRKMNVGKVEKTEKSDEEITFTSGYHEASFIAVKVIVEKLKKNSNKIEKEIKVSDFLYYTLEFLREAIKETIGVDVSHSDIVNYVCQWYVVTGVVDRIVKAYKIIKNEDIDLDEDDPFGRRIPYSLEKIVKRLRPLAKNMFPTEKTRTITLSLDEYSREIITAVGGFLGTDLSETLERIFLFASTDVEKLVNMVVSMAAINTFSMEELIRKFEYKTGLLEIRLSLWDPVDI